MFRPEKMSQITVYINKDFIPIFISDLSKIKYFHVKRHKSEIQPTTKRRNKPQTMTRSSAFINQKDLEKINQGILSTQKYIRELLNATKINLGSVIKIKKGKDFKKTQFEFSHPVEMIDSLTNRVENLYKKWKKLRDEKTKSDENLEMVAKVASLLNLISKFGAEKDYSDQLKHLNFDLYTTSNLDYKEIRIAVEQLNSPIVIYGEEIGPNIIGLFTFYDADDKEQISKFFLNHNCQKFEISKRYLDENGIYMKNLQEDHDKTLKYRNKITQKYEDLIKSLPMELLSCYEALENSIKIVDILKEIDYTPSHHIVKLSGFIPAKLKDDIKSALSDQFKTNVKIEIQDIEYSSPYETEIHETEEEFEIVQKHQVPPSLITMNKVQSAFSSLVKLYGITNYSEIDPSMILVVTFPIIFGLMFGDFGHGLVLLFAGLFFSYNAKKKRKDNNNLGIITIFLGIGSMVGGLLYGESFGEPLIINGTHIVLFATPAENISKVLKMSIYIGVVMLTFGWVLRMINLIMNKRKFYAIGDPLLKIIILLAGTQLVMGTQFDINAWLTPPYPILNVIIPAIVMVLIKPFGRVVGITPYIKHESVGALLGESIMDLSETMLQIIGNVASFIRILALAMAHYGLMIVVLEMQKLIGGGIFGFILAIFGNAFVIVLEVIIVLIHTLRLHFYEFFSKFYIADGYEFKSFSLKSEYSEFTYQCPEHIKLEIDFQCPKIL